jgi:uncharacterized protein (TIGR03084 family)
MSEQKTALTQAFDYRLECDALYEVLRTANASAWNKPTLFKSWTFADVLGHLHLFDRAALVTLESPDAFGKFTAGIRDARVRGHTLTAYTRDWLGGASNGELLERWYAFSRELAETYARLDPSRRVTWGGLAMSVRSCISARQMETWAHGQAVFDALGRERVETDRLKNVAVIGVNTFGWTFTNRKLEVPGPAPYVKLTSPSGALWEWNAPSESQRIEGSALDFCRVVAQTRNVADTRLHVVGPIAKAWMAIAQCFAGPPEDPPAPGSRFVQR